MRPSWHTCLSTEKSWKCETLQSFILGSIQAGWRTWRTLQGFSMMSTPPRFKLLKCGPALGKGKLTNSNFIVAGHPLANGETQPKWHEPVYHWDSFKAGGPTWWEADWIISQSALFPKLTKDLDFCIAKPPMSMNIPSCYFKVDPWCLLVFLPGFDDWT